MNHLRVISRTAQPTAATSILEWEQIGAVIGVFIGSIATLGDALGAYLAFARDVKTGPTV